MIWMGKSVRHKWVKVSLERLQSEKLIMLTNEIMGKRTTDTALQAVYCRGKADLR